MAFVVVEPLVDEPMVDLTMFSNVDFTVGLTTGFLTVHGDAGLDGDRSIPSHRHPWIRAAPSRVDPGGQPHRTGSHRTTVRKSCRSVWPAICNRHRPHRALLCIISSSSSSTRRPQGIGFSLILAPIGLGMGIFQSPNNSAIMGSVPPDQLGVAGGMLGLNRLLGQVAGFAILITYWSSRVSAGSPDVALPEAQASAFRDTNLGGAAAVLLALMLVVWVLRRDRTRQRADG